MSKTIPSTVKTPANPPSQDGSRAAAPSGASSCCEQFSRGVLIPANGGYVEREAIHWVHLPMPTTEDEVGTVEKAVGHKFPDDYCTFARLFAGGSPIQSDFSFPDGELTFHAGIGVFLSFDHEDPYGILPTMETTESFPAGLVPIGEDGGGNHVCLDYRRSEEPLIVFWHHGRSGEPDETSFVSRTFAELIGMLREPDDEATE